uniref:Uncharacterized protein n=2 Tax=Meloidogyne TaxID=189290 RepID=A0A6V7VA69_MELEN|nr:unnamed protein product [Meloidogyne enterolobii]CAD2171318.1 unnamed protein product [Meloidogyne enterolobii]
MSVVGPLLKKFPIEARQHEAINKMKLKKSPNARVFSFEDIHFKQVVSSQPLEIEIFEKPWPVPGLWV